MMSPLYFRPSKVAASGPRLRIAAINTYVDNHDVARILKVTENAELDVVYISELTTEVDAAMRASPRFPYAYSRPESISPWGSGLYSRFPLQNPKFIPVRYGCPTVRAKIEVEGSPVTIYGAHPVPPAGRAWTALRDDTLHRTAQEIAKESTPVILAGDFNSTPWSYSFRDCLTESNLHDARRGFGLRTSWNAKSFVFKIPIDHLLVSPGIAVENFTIGPPTGSDHLPVIADVRLPAPAAKPAPPASP
jgi:endonuclease/exonuclease/phosphatase (EEP) superfamily protein YafD